ncbi:MAG: SulP family inorganic anion transporter [Burkholderiales bacterium]|nr:SulP family inorganic anion transporter [Burkholderiales bacterium]
MPALPRFRPRLFEIYGEYNVARLRADVLAGITVGILALPLAIAFAIASGMTPESGIYTAIIAGFIISAFGGSRVQIGGPTGAFIVIVYGIVVQYGVANLLICTLMAGVMLLAMGLLRMGSWIRFIPVSVISGFTKGIAVLILLSQFKDFLGLQTSQLPAEFFAQITVLWNALHTINWVAVGLSMACLLLIVFWPKRWSLLPSPIVALVFGTLAATLFNLPVETIGSKFGGIPQTLPSFALPELSLDKVRHLIAPAIAIALLGAIESLLSATVADNMIDDRHDPNQELMAQGLANIAAPLFGGFCATGAIARTSTNVRMGAFGPVSGIVHAATLLVVILVAAPLAKHVPLAALSAILVVVAWKMGEWSDFREMRRYTMNYRAVLLATFVLTVVFDLVVAVEVGLVMAAVLFITRISSLTGIVDDGPDTISGNRVRAYEMFGSLFFGSANKLEPLLAHADPGDPCRILVLDIQRTINIDTTGLDILESLRRKMKKNGKALVITGAGTQPLSLFTRSGFADRLGADNLFPHRSAGIAHARGLAGGARRPD